MARIPLLSNRSDRAANYDDNSDESPAEVVPANDRPWRNRVFGGTAVRDQELNNPDERTVIRSDGAEVLSRRTAAATAAPAETVTPVEPAVPVERDRFGEPDTAGAEPYLDTEPTGTEPAVLPVGRSSEVRGHVAPRPRGSLLASLGLLFGVVAVLAVLTGMLAKPAIAVGVLAAAFSIGGLSATARRHVAGRFDAMLGLTLAVAAVVLGILAVAGMLPWLTTDTDQVPRVRDWVHDGWQWVMSLRS